MDIRLVLVNSITLLYQASLISDTYYDDAKDSVTELLKETSMPEASADEFAERNSLLQMHQTAKWMLGKDSNFIDKKELLQRIRLNTGKDDRLYDTFLEAICDYEDKDELTKIVNDKLHGIRKHLGREKLRKVLKQASHTVSFKSDTIGNWSDFVGDLLNQLETSTVSTSKAADPSIVSSVNFNDADTVTKGFDTLQQVLSTEGIIKTPWKRLNKLYGEQDGIRRGEMWSYEALAHNYKSGMLLDIAIGAALFNDPFTFDISKQGHIELISTEDDMEIILKRIYMILVHHYHNLPVVMQEIDMEVARNFVIEKLTARGWSFEITRVKPSEFTYRKLIQLLEQRKKEGKEICLLVLDYLSMFNKAGCNTGSTGDDVQDLFRRIREYTAANKIAVQTAHQLSTEAKALKRIYETNFLDHVIGKGYTDGCRKVDNELDGELYGNKINVRGRTLLEVGWGKHRGVVPYDKHKYFLLPFRPAPMYGLEYDFDKEIDVSLDTANGRSQADGGGSDWYDGDY